MISPRPGIRSPGNRACLFRSIARCSLLVRSVARRFLGSLLGALSTMHSRYRQIQSSRLIHFLLLLTLVFCLAGCGNGGSLPPGISAAVVTVVTAVWKLRNLGALGIYRSHTTGDPLKDYITQVGQDVKLFLRFRAEAHLATDTNIDHATQAVAAEYDSVSNFIRNSVQLDPDVSPSPFIAGTDKTPGHLDLSDVLRILSTDGPVSQSKIQIEHIRRWERAMRIIWRGAALEPDLWNPNFSETAMMEILDRRLRITERMLYQIAAEVSDRGVLQPSAAATHGPWFDGTRVRMFEYPILDQSFKDKVGAANIGPAGIWTEGFPTGDLTYNEGNRRRIRAAAQSEFVPATGTGFIETYPYDLVPGAAPAQAIDHLFTPAEDWWDRSWIYCDHVLAAIHLESLRFGKLRREGNDNTFNSAVNGHAQGWAELRPLLPSVPGDPKLMSDDAGKPPGEPRLFANGPVKQIQLGDHIVFWNSIMYGLLNDGAWSLENAIVVGLESDWAANDIGDSVHLMGHGTADTLAGRFREELTRALDQMLVQARQRVKATAGNTAGWLRSAAPLVRWAPFGESWIDESGAPQDPWWIRVPYDPTPDWAGRALGRDATLRTLPDAVEYDPTAGFTSPPPTPAPGVGPNNAAYFPLWWPAQTGAWKGYIQKRQSGKTPSTFRLEPVRFQGANIPGLIVPGEFIPGANTPRVYTVRPIVAR